MLLTGKLMPHEMLFRLLDEIHTTVKMDTGESTKGNLKQK